MKQLYIILLTLIFVSGNKASAQNTFDPYFVETSDTTSTRGPNCIVRDLLQDRNGDYWLATWQGIIRYDGKVFTNYTLKEGLIHFHVSSVYEDKKGDLWFGTVRGGIYRYDGKSFTLFTTKDGLGDNSATCILEDKTGNIWFSGSSGVTRYDGKTFKNFTTEDGLCSNDMNPILQDKTGKMWFGGLGGISCCDPLAPVGTGDVMFTRFTNKEGLPFEKVASLLEDENGNIWIGGSKGLCRYDYDEKSLGDPVVPNFVMYMCQDKTGNLWFAFNESGPDQKRNFVLCRYDGTTVSKIKPDYGPGNAQIFGIIEDRNGNIWFGTAKGICRFDPLRADHSCVRNTCKHDLADQQGPKQHEKEMNRAFTWFTE